MPTYDYRCTKCGHHFELFHSIKDETVKRCPRCRGKAVRVPSAGAGILFKGSGFYITDYRSSSYKEKAKQEKSGGSSGGSESGGGSSKGSDSGGAKKSSSRGGGGGAAD
jgi:putative FmdB family regulatory protein